MVHSNEYEIMSVSEYSVMGNSNDYNIAEFGVNDMVVPVGGVPVNQLNSYEDPGDRKNRILGSLFAAAALGAGSVALADLLGYSKAITAYELGKKYLKK